MVNLRPVTTEDAANLAQLEARIFETDAWPEADIAGMLGVPNVYGMAAAIDGEDLGYGLLQVAPKAVADILTIGVVPEARRKGVAEAVLKAMFEKAKEHEVPSVFLEVRASNKAAHAFYEKHGAKVAGKRPGYYRAQEGLPAEDALVYQFSL